MAQGDDKIAYMRERAVEMLLGAAPEIVEFVYRVLLRNVR